MKLLGGCHRAFEVREASQVGEARRQAVRLAESLGYDEVAAGRVALVATELGTNLVRHAQHGALWLAALQPDEGPALVELLSVDRGPGLADLAQPLRDGYSTGGTPGTGLGAVRRLATTFDIHSQPGSGTVILARVGADDPARRSAAERERGREREADAATCATVALPAPGESVCGDAVALRRHAAGGCGLLVADGLGHGPEAAEAAQAAVLAYQQAPAGGSPAAAIERLHAPLRSTRGAAVAVAEVAADGRIAYAGAGNIAGRLVSGTEDRALVSQHGTAGVAMRRLQDTHYAWPLHALLVMHSDGVASRWTLAEPGLLQRHPAVVAAWLLREHRRGRDDATVAVMKRKAA